MALRNFLSQRFFNWHAMAVQLDAQVTIGSSGAPTLVTSSAASSIPTSRGIKAITRLTTGIYRVQLDDNYSQLLDYKANFTAGAGSTVAAGAFVPGTVYRILTMGTTTQAQWVAAGFPSGLTAAVGMVFKASGVGAGNGTVKELVCNAVDGIELLGTPSGQDQMLNNQPFVQGNGGGYIIFQCRAGTPVGTNGALTFTGTPLGTHTHVFTGDALGAHTHTFTGDALGTHSHTIPVTAGTAGDAVTNNAGVLESTGGQDLTTSADSAGTPAGTNSSDSAGTPAGSNAATSAGTPAGTINTPAFTGTLPIAADPTDGSTMYLRFLLSNSKVG